MVNEILKGNKIFKKIKTKREKDRMTKKRNKNKII